jgi:hypothetical protein
MMANKVCEEEVELDETTFIDYLWMHEQLPLVQCKAVYEEVAYNLE